METTSGIPASKATAALQAAEEKKRLGAEGNQAATPAVVEKVTPTPEARCPSCGWDGQTKTEYPADVKAELEKVRQQEKQKLYDKLSKLEHYESENGTLKQNVTLLTDQNAELQSAVDTLKAKVEKASSKAKKEDNPGFDVQALIEDTAAQATAAMKKQFDEERAQYTTEIRELTSRVSALQGDSLAAFRQRLIDEAGGKIVAELVKGSTEEELRASALEAKAVYARYFPAGAISSAEPAANASSSESAQTPQGTTPTATMPQTHSVPAANGVQPAAPTPLSAPRPATSGVEGIPAQTEEEKLHQDVRNMSPEDYAANRKKILSRVRQIYPRNPNPLTSR